MSHHAITIDDEPGLSSESSSVESSLNPSTYTKKTLAAGEVPYFEPLLRIPSDFATPGTIHRAPLINAHSGVVDSLAMGNSNEAATGDKANQYIFLPTKMGKAEGRQLLTVRPGKQNFKAKHFVHVVTSVPNLASGNK